MRRLKKIASVLRNEARGKSPAEFWAFLRTALFQNDRILIYCRALRDAPSLDPPAGGPRVTRGSAADLDTARRQASSIPWEFQCDRYDGVTDCYVYRHDGRIGHISWVYCAQHPNRILRLADGECEVKFCLTLPEFRGLGLYPAALQAIQRDMKSRGFTRCFICVRPENTASIRGIEKAGFSPVGAVQVRKLLGVQISRRRRTGDVCQDQTHTSRNRLSFARLPLTSRSTGTNRSRPSPTRTR